MESTAVFLGPTLLKKDAQKLFNSDYYPPIKQGDLLSLIQCHKYQNIVIIDGLFDQELSVWHKEILTAISMNIRVYGCSSMGALRAAELHEFGMVGHGVVYNWYKSNFIEDDDEVCLAHLNHLKNFLPVTIPMVNLRYTFINAIKLNLIDKKLVPEIINHLKKIYYLDRTKVKILKECKLIFNNTTFEQINLILNKHYIDIKKNDAITLLKKLSLDQPNRPKASKLQFKEESKQFLNAFNQHDQTIPNTSFNLRSIFQQTIINSDNFLETHTNALNRQMTIEFAKFLKITPSTKSIFIEDFKFRLKNKLLSKKIFDNWLIENHLNENLYENLIYEEALCFKMHKWFIHTKSTFTKSNTPILNYLRVNDEFKSEKKKLIKNDRSNINSLNDLLYYFDKNFISEYLGFHDIRELNYSLEKFSCNETILCNNPTIFGISIHSNIMNNISRFRTLLSYIAYNWNYQSDAYIFGNGIAKKNILNIINIINSINIFKKNIYLLLPLQKIKDFTTDIVKKNNLAIIIPIDYESHNDIDKFLKLFNKINKYPIIFELKYIQKHFHDHLNFWRKFANHFLENSHKYNFPQVQIILNNLNNYIEIRSGTDNKYKKNENNWIYIDKNNDSWLKTNVLLKKKIKINFNIYEDSLLKKNFTNETTSLSFISIMEFYLLERILNRKKISNKDNHQDVVN